MASVLPLLYTVPVKIRVIPRLDIKGPNIVKGVRMEGLRVVGSPAMLARTYYEQGADELLALDIVASLYGRSLDLDIIRSIAQEVFIPLTVGGGIQSLHDISHVLRAGADKVALNTFALRNPAFLQEAVREFGSQCIVLSVEAKRRGEGWEAYTEGGREHSGRDVVEWVKEALGLGVGEILLTSVDRDGTKTGYDVDLLRTIASFATVPVIAHGGARDAASLADAVVAGADAVSLSWILHFKECTIPQLKEGLAERSLSVRRSSP
ncbi:MAG: imidazole glycerol phosphate synthase cyclase subunit [Candidatus Peribacteraceae bacterium]|nr:imidazole glycerol phosphate synthase cyclase subunit [Candidatus Peribacteraceae bacterium]